MAQTVMNQTKPKLLVLGGPHVDTGVLGEVLSQHFEVVTAAPGEALRTLASEGCQAVIAEAGDFVPLERDLIDRQASMLLNALGEGLALVSGEGKVLWANRRFRLFDAAVRRRVADACRWAAAKFGEAIRATGQAPKSKVIDVSLRKTQRSFEVLVTPVLVGGSEMGQARAGQGEGAGPVQV
ncbi:MAG: hypothetical protein IBJ11_11590, partial [Phycisphaerales bacterium]|nr:hypothetical protein [Phycisphaerales bacterium]